MGVYFFLIALGIYFYIINRCINMKKVEKVLLFIFFIVLFSISSLRKHVGTDYGVYLHVYKTISDKTYSIEGMEFGYFYLNKLVSILFGGEYTIFIITSAITIGLIYLTVKKFSVDPLLSGILFMCLMYITGFNVVRQFIAMALIFYSLRYCETNIKWIVPIIAASLFHTTALFIIPFYLISKRALGKRAYIFIAMIGFILFLGYGRTVAYLLNFFERFNHYEGSNFVTEGANPIRTLISISIFLFCLLSYEEIMKDRKMRFSFSMFLFGVVCSLFMMKGKIFARIVDYFCIFQIILIPYALSNLNRYNLKKYKTVISIFIILVSIYYFYYSVKTGQSGSTPYRTYIGDLDIQKKILSWFYNIE